MVPEKKCHKANRALYDSLLRSHFCQWILKTKYHKVKLAVCWMPPGPVNYDMFSTGHCSQWLHRLFACACAGLCRSRRYLRSRVWYFVRLFVCFFLGLLVFGFAHCWVPCYTIKILEPLGDAPNEVISNSHFHQLNVADCAEPRVAQIVDHSAMGTPLGAWFRVLVHVAFFFRDDIFWKRPSGNNGRLCPNPHACKKSLL